MPVNKVRRRGSYAPLSAHYAKDVAVIEAGEKAELLYVRGLAFCADVLSDGFISDVQLPHVAVGLSGVQARARKLVEVGLWERARGGYHIRSWLGWNKSRDDILTDARKDSSRKSSGPEDVPPPPEPPPDEAPEHDPYVAESDRNGHTSPNGFRPDSERNPNGSHAGARAGLRPRPPGQGRAGQGRAGHYGWWLFWGIVRIRTRRPPNRPPEERDEHERRSLWPSSRRRPAVPRLPSRPAEHPAGRPRRAPSRGHRLIARTSLPHVRRRRAPPRGRSLRPRQPLHPLRPRHRPRPAGRPSDGGLVTAEPSALADMLRDVLVVTGVETQRHDVVRRGERDPIPTMTRLLVWLRDGGTCARCRRADRSLMQLDHIEPWSAGGDDSASNLRVMCGPCNEDRSNFRELGGPRPRASVTPMCDRCVEHHGERRAWTARRRHDQIAQRRPIGCPVCAGSVRIDEWDPPVIAWCGTCGALSAVTGPGRIL